MNKKYIVIILAFLILLIPVATMAASFTDLDSDHWAYGYIERLTNKKILNGYPDGSFKPDKYVSFIEILSVIRGLTNPTEEQTKSAFQLYNKLAEKYKIEDWAKEAFCLALYNNIIYESELTELNKNGIITDIPQEGQFPSREYIAVVFGRALEVAPSYDHSNLKYADADQIGKAFASDLDVKDYLSALVKIGVFDASGSEGKFEPLRPVRRSEIAKITELSYNYLASKNN